MTPQRPLPSGAPATGRLADLPPLERGVVVYLRMWCSGGEALGQLQEDFRLALGARAGQEAAARLDRFLRLLLGQAHRPLLRHALGCPCLGADEIAVARQVALAAAGDREAALRLALDHVPADAAHKAIALAEPLGLAIHSILGGPIGRALPSRP